MEKAIVQAVERVIGFMQDNLGEQLTIDDMARTAMFSKFHFSRAFRQVTGVSPGRFLSALRIQEAKRLLVSTTLSVADISNRVGYTSVGTFSSRFKSSVGLAPTSYRSGGGFTSRVLFGSRRTAMRPRSATVRGNINPASPDYDGLVFAGLFPGRIPQGAPVTCTILTRPGPYVLENVPPGTWHLLVQCAAYGCEDTDEGNSDRLSVGTYGPFTIQTSTLTKFADVQLRPKQTLDPPVLLALPAAGMTEALSAAR